MVRKGRPANAAQAADRGYYQLSLRLPAELHAQLTAARVREERSLHAQIIWCLRQCMDARGTQRRRAEERDGHD